MKAESGQSQMAVPPPTSVPGTEVGVSLSALRHSYGELQTLAAIDLQVPAGDVVGLVGPSGCG
jgi:ABC-type transporter Mla maintaining outer membrane lipid asymmetry ATPase subunit MlaF